MEKSTMMNLGQTISFHDFYQAMKNGADTKTAQVNASEYEEHFEKFLKQDKDILHICLSSGLSGTTNSANIAKTTLLEKYPNRKIYIVDSLSATSGYGLMMDKLSQLRAEGLSIDEAHCWIEQHKLELQHCIFSTDLSFYVKGGRISKANGIVGGALGICPILSLDTYGRIVVKGKVRGKKRAIREVVNYMEKYAADGLEYSDLCYIAHSDYLDEAQNLKELIESKFENLRGKIKINEIGTTIGSHTGPGTVAVFFWGKDRS